MPYLYILCGLPGAGKSTIAQSLSKIYSAQIFSSDATRKILFGDENIQKNPQKVFRYMHNNIHTALKLNKNVIYDATCLTKKIRQSIIHEFSDAIPICIFINTPVSICLQNNQKRLRQVPEYVILRMAQQLQPPEISEGFYEIKIINNY